MDQSPTDMRPLISAKETARDNTNRNKDSSEDSIVSNTKGAVYHILSLEYIP